MLALQNFTGVPSTPSGFTISRRSKWKTSRNPVTHSGEYENVKMMIKRGMSGAPLSSSLPHLRARHTFQEFQEAMVLAHLGPRAVQLRDPGPCLGAKGEPLGTHTRLEGTRRNRPWERGQCPALPSEGSVLPSPRRGGGSSEKARWAAPSPTLIMLMM